MTTTIELLHFHLFVGLGGGARGFNRASPRVGNLRGRFRCIGGNAVPSAAATAIAEVMGETLLLARAGETFQLSARPVWVRPVALALSVRGAA